MSKWEVAQAWEKNWWGDCANTYFEEQKQLLYADRMGLVRVPDAKTPYRFDLKGKSVLDIGGGPCSLLLKCVNVEGTVADPLDFPDWVAQRYDEARIEYWKIKGEDWDITYSSWDECWIYNLLQHVDDPKRVIKVARKVGKLIRIFEWINTHALNEGHPHILREKELNEWLGGEGKVEKLTGQNGCRGMAYYGIFTT